MASEETGMTEVIVDDIIARFPTLKDFRQAYTEKGNGQKVFLSWKRNS